VEIIQNNLGYINLKDKKYRKAISYLNDAMPYVKGKRLVLLYNNLSEANKGLDKFEKALEYSG